MAGEGVSARDRGHINFLDRVFVRHVVACRVVVCATVAHIRYMLWVVARATRVWNICWVVRLSVLTLSVDEDTEYKHPYSTVKAYNFGRCKHTTS